MGKGGRGGALTENGADLKVRPVGSDGAPSPSSFISTNFFHRRRAAPAGAASFNGPHRWGHSCLRGLVHGKRRGNRRCNVGGAAWMAAMPAH